MEKMNIEQLRNRQMQIADYIAAVCEENGLKYYLAYGTLIGAVRHKGYIPWDDDIDLFMLRADYEKLIELINNDQNSRYKCFSLSGNKAKTGDYYYPFSKVTDMLTIEEVDSSKPIEGLGVNVDIFVLDYYNGSKSLIRKLKLQFHKFHLSMNTRYIWNSRNFIKRIAYAFYKHKKPKKYALKIDKLSQSCKKPSDKLFCGYTGEVFKTEWLGEGVILDFEDRKYRCPANYDAVLRTCFGDYMQLPPEEERVLPHGSSFYEIGEDNN